MAPQENVLAFRSSEIDFDAIWANLGGKNEGIIFISFSMTRGCTYLGVMFGRYASQTLRL